MVERVAAAAGVLYRSGQHHLSSHFYPQQYSAILLPLGSNLRNGVGTTGNGLVATAALPDTNSLALDGVLSAEGADVAGVLLDFHLLHLLTQGGTVSIIEHIELTITLSRRRFFFCVHVSSDENF